MPDPAPHGAARDDAALIARVREAAATIRFGKRSLAFKADLLALCSLAERLAREQDQLETTYADYVELAKGVWAKQAARVAALEKEMAFAHEILCMGDEESRNGVPDILANALRGAAPRRDADGAEEKTDVQ